MANSDISFGLMGVLTYRTALALFFRAAASPALPFITYTGSGLFLSGLTTSET